MGDLGVQGGKAVGPPVRQGIAGGLLGQGSAEIRDAPANGRVY